MNFLARTIIWLDRWVVARRHALIMRIGPPIIFLIIVFGHWDVVLIALLVCVSVFCTARIIFLGFKRRYPRALRPSLTAIVAIGYLALGEHYEDRAGVYISQTAQTLQDICNRQRHCVAPANWQRAENQSRGDYFLDLPGLVPLRVQLSLYEPPFSPATCRYGEKVLATECPSPVSFLIRRNSEDSSGATGGVDEPLQIWRRKSW